MIDLINNIKNIFIENLLKNNYNIRMNTNISNKEEFLTFLEKIVIQKLKNYEISIIELNNDVFHTFDEPQPDFYYHDTFHKKDKKSIPTLNFKLKIKTEIKNKNILDTKIIADIFKNYNIYKLGGSSHTEYKDNIMYLTTGFFIACEDFPNLSYNIILTQYLDKKLSKIDLFDLLKENYKNTIDYKSKDFINLFENTKKYYFDFQQTNLQSRYEKIIINNELELLKNINTTNSKSHNKI